VPTTLRKDGDELVLKLGGLDKAEFQDALQKAKALPGRHWDNEEKTWRYPATADNAMRLIHTIRTDADEGVLAMVKQRAEEIAQQLAAHTPDDAEVAIPWGHHLFPYQRAGVRVMADWRKSFNTDQRGLGKTVQALGAVQEAWYDVGFWDHPRPPQGLIIANRSVRRHWARHIDVGPTIKGKPIWPDWDYPGDVTILDHRTKKGRLKQLENRADVVIVNWEQVRQQGMGPELQAIPFDFEIADAINRAKNPTAAQTKGLHALTAPMQIGMTGSPIWNSPDELWGPLRWLDKKTYGSYWWFFHTYVFYYEGFYGRVITGVKNSDDLRSALKTTLLRRTKKQVLKDLPDKLPPKVLEVDLHPAQRKLYDEAEKAVWLEVEQAVEEDPEIDRERLGEIVEAGDFKALSIFIPKAGARIVRLRQIASTPALLGAEDKSVKLDTVEEIVFEDADSQFVVFAHFKDTVRIMAERINRRAKQEDAVWFHGDTEEDARDAAVQAFMAGEARVICTTIRAGGEGIDLYAADTAIFIERDWTPSANEEAEDRLHRIGQKNPVQIITVDAADTIDVQRVRPTNRLKELISMSVLGSD
jgi:SWI/SNF-related matrix-associated actin-dependent regulator 1 of chromatin subfamily A